MRSGKLSVILTRPPAFRASVISLALLGLLGGCQQKASNSGPDRPAANATPSASEATASDSAASDSAASDATDESQARPVYHVSDSEAEAGQEVSSESKADNPPSEATKIKQPNLAADNALLQSCLDGDIKSVYQALSSGANVNASDPEGNSPLMLAAFDGHDDIVRLLLERGAKVNACNLRGFTALILAASGPNPGTVELLLKKGAHVDTRERAEGFTALMYAASEGHPDNVKLLLSSGADPSLRDVDNDSAADFARKNGHVDVLKLLPQEQPPR